MGDSRADHKRDRSTVEQTTDFITNAGSEESLLTNTRRLIENAHYLIKTLAIVIILVLVWPVAIATGPHDCSHWWPVLRLPKACEPPPPTHYAIQDYLTKNPAIPPKKTEPAGPLGITANTPVSTISAIFPPAPQTTHTVGAEGQSDIQEKGWHQEAWTWQGLTLTVEVQTVTGSTRAIHLTRWNDSPWFVAAPGRILLGSSTAQSLIDRRGDSGDMHALYDETGIFTFELSYSPPDTETTTYQSHTRLEDVEPPPIGSENRLAPERPYPRDSAPCRSIIFDVYLGTPYKPDTNGDSVAREQENFSCLIG